MNNREDYLKDLETINAQIMAVEKEIADLDTKRATLKEKIKLLQQLKHSIAGFKVQPEGCYLHGSLCCRTGDGSRRKVSRQNRPGKSGRCVEKTMIRERLCQR